MCMLDHFGSLACVAILYESFDIFSYLWPIVWSADEFASFCRSAMSDLWGFVTGTGYCLVSSSVGYSVCFMIEFDTHDVVCLVSSIV